MEINKTRPSQVCIAHVYFFLEYLLMTGRTFFYFTFFDKLTQIKVACQRHAMAARLVWCRFRGQVQLNTIIEQ